MPKQSHDYWVNVCDTHGVPIVGLTNQDIEVKALRSLGFGGTLFDMRYQFYIERNPQYYFMADAIHNNDPNQP